MGQPSDDRNMSKLFTGSGNNIWNHIEVTYHLTTRGFLAWSPYLSSPFYELEWYRMLNLYTYQAFYLIWPIWKKIKTF